MIQAGATYNPSEAEAMNQNQPDRRPGPLRQLIRSDLGQGSAGDDIDANDMAAWLEGRLPEAAAARVEAELSRDRQQRQALLAMRDAPAAALSPAQLRRAQSLVGPQRPPRPAIDWQRRLAWWVRPLPAGALAVVLFVAGFSLGSRIAAEAAAREALALAQLLGPAPSL